MAKRRYYINGESLVLIQTQQTSSTLETVDIQIQKPGEQLAVGDTLLYGGGQYVIVVLYLAEGGRFMAQAYSPKTLKLIDILIDPEATYTVIVQQTNYNTGANNGLLELGLSVDQIIISPRFVHRNMTTDDFGPDVPADVMWYMGTARIIMTLLHFDTHVLDFCLMKTMAGGTTNDDRNIVSAGDSGGMGPAGTPLGGGKALYTEGNHFVGLIIKSVQANNPWNFPAAYLEDSVEWPLGTERSAVRLQWRAIPYVDAAGSQGPRGDWLKSEGATLWTHPTTATGKTTS